MKPTCFFCGKDCTDLDLCRGCRIHVCAGCDNPVADERPQGEAHHPEAHRAHAVKQ